MRRLAPLSVCLAMGCGGVTPLLHPAHALREGEFTVGGGFSGAVPLRDSSEPAPDDPNGEAVAALRNGTQADGLSPWAGARLGVGADFDAGLTYGGRAIRADIRHAFMLGDDIDDPAISLGLGASALLPKRRDDVRVGGGGADIPILFGLRSNGEVYSLWLGGRGGFNILNGQRDLLLDPSQPDAPVAEGISGAHVYGGGLLGVRVGFRYVFATFEVAATGHWIDGTVGSRSLTLTQFELTPAGALVIRF